MRDVKDIVDLLTIVDKARQWPKLQGLHDQAMVELEKIASPPKQETPKSWQGPSSQSSAPTPPSLKPVVRPQEASQKLEM